MQVTGGETYHTELYAKGTISTGDYGLRVYDASGNQIDTPWLGGFSTSTSWQSKVLNTYTMPSNASTAKVEVRGKADGYVDIDDVWFGTTARDSNCSGGGGNGGTTPSYSDLEWTFTESSITGSPGNLNRNYFANVSADVDDGHKWKIVITKGDGTPHDEFGGVTHEDAGATTLNMAGSVPIGVHHIFTVYLDYDSDNEGFIPVHTYEYYKPTSSTASNLIANPSFNNGSTGWDDDTWNATANFSTANGFARIDTFSGSGDAKWVSDSITVSPSTTYYIGAFYKTDDHAELMLEVTKSDGSKDYPWLGWYGSQSSMTEIAETYTTPADAISMTVRVLLKGPNYLETDDYWVSTDPRP